MATTTEVATADRFLGALRGHVNQLRITSVNITSLENSWGSLTAPQQTNILNVLVARGYEQADLTAFFSALKLVRDTINVEIPANFDDSVI